MNIGKVREARKGEIPTHYAMEDIKRGRGVVAMPEEKEAGEAFIHFSFGEPLFEAMRGRMLVDLQSIYYKERRAERAVARIVRWIIAGAFIALCASVIYATMVHAQTIEVNLQDDHIPAVGKMVPATVTAYSSSVDETDDTPFITANGEHVGHGTLACPTKYPFGTKIKIEGRVYTCKDRMNARYRNIEHFDVWQGSKEEALNFGKKEVTVEVL